MRLRGQGARFHRILLQHYMYLSQIPYVILDIILYHHTDLSLTAFLNLTSDQCGLSTILSL